MKSARSGAVIPDMQMKTGDIPCCKAVHCTNLRYLCHKNTVLWMQLGGFMIFQGRNEHPQNMGGVRRSEVTKQEKPSFLRKVGLSFSLSNRTFKGLMITSSGSYVRTSGPFAGCFRDDGGRSAWQKSGSQLSRTGVRKCSTGRVLLPEKTGCWKGKRF